jgi:hypothetical protein
MLNNSYALCKALHGNGMREVDPWSLFIVHIVISVKINKDADHLPGSHDMFKFDPVNFGKILRGIVIQNPVPEF